MAKTQLRLGIETKKKFTQTQLDKILKELTTAQEDDYKVFSDYAQEHIKIVLTEDKTIRIEEKEFDNSINNLDSEAIFNAIENIVDYIPSLNGYYTEMLETDGSVQYVPVKDSEIGEIKNFKDWDALNIFQEKIQ